MTEPALTISDSATELFGVIDAIVAQQALGAKSLSDLREMKESDEPLWVIRDFIRVGATHHCFGSRRTGKSHLMLDMAFRIAGGDDSFLGFPILRHGRCLYFMLEEGYLNLRGVLQNHPYYGNEIPIDFCESLKLKLDSKKDWERLEHACNGAILCVIDPLAALQSRFKRNDPEDARLLMNRLNEIAMKTGCAIVVVNHETKRRHAEIQFPGKTAEDRTALEADKFKGSGELADLATVAFQLSSYSTDRAKLSLFPGKHSLPTDRILYRNEGGWLTSAPRDSKRYAITNPVNPPVPIVE
jgi:hypothetical protein